MVLMIRSEKVATPPDAATVVVPLRSPLSEAPVQVQRDGDVRGDIRYRGFRTGRQRRPAAEGDVFGDLARRLGRPDQLRRRRGVIVIDCRGGLGQACRSSPEAL